MSDPVDVVELGVVLNDAGDTITVGLQAGNIHLEVANPGREPVEVWLAPAEARGLIGLLRLATGERDLTPEA